MFVSGPWIARLSAAGAAAAMQVGFGGLNIASSAEAGAAGRAARDCRRRSHQGARGTDVRRLQGDRRRRRTSTSIRVYAHVYAEEDVRHALEAGVDVLQHVGSAGTAPPYSKELITDIVNAGRPVVVTAAHRAWVYPDTAAFPERLQDPDLKERVRARTSTPRCRTR